MRRPQFLPHLPVTPTVPRSRRSDTDGALPELRIDAVDGAHEFRALLPDSEQVKLALDSPRRSDVHEHHARLREVETGLVDAPQPPDCRIDDQEGVRSRSQQADCRGLGVLLALGKRTRMDEDEDLGGCAVLPPQLLGCPAGEGAHGFDQGRKLAYPLPEAAGACNLLFRRSRVFESDAGLPLQFPDRPFENDGPSLPDERRVEIRELQGVRDAHLFELRPDFPADAPDIADRCRGENGVQVGRGQCSEVADVAEVFGVATGLSHGGLGDVVRKLGEGLGRSDADACGKPQPVLQAVPDDVGTADKVSAYPVETDEAFIDGVDFLIRTQSGGDSHEAAAHVAIEDEIGGNGDDAFVRELPSDLEERVSHLDSQSLRLVGTGDGAAVVVAQNDDRTPFQRRSEDTFA